MRVLHLIDSLDASGGAERSLAAMAPALEAAGIDLHVGYLRRCKQSVEASLRAGDAEIHELAGGGGRAGNVIRVAHLVRVLRPDLVHTVLFEADQAGRMGTRLAGGRVVTSLVNIAYGQDQSTSPTVRNWKLKAAQRLDVLTARLAVRFHAITAHVADIMSARLHVPRERIDVVRRGRDPAQLGRRTLDRRNRARCGLGMSAERPLVLAIGRQEWQKGHDLLVAAVPDLLSRWPDLVVAIAGRRGERTIPLQAQIAHLKLSSHVRLLDFRDDALDLLCAADVFALPSRWEGLGGSLLEAMALQAPIVASDLPAVREVVTPETATFVPPGRSEALALAIGDSLADRWSATARATRARQRFLDKFTIDRFGAEIVAFYERAMSPGS
jgi:glycosyltransferase involved in cell wall biosynthesis